MTEAVCLSLIALATTLVSSITLVVIVKSVLDCKPSSLKIWDKEKYIEAVFNKANE